MLKRLILGLVIGVVIGGLAGYGVTQVLPAAMAGALGYALAAVVGVLVGLVAGRPIWAKGAAVEAGLKAIIGAALGCAILFGIRFLGFTIPEVGGIAAAPLGRHAVGALVAVATLLAVFYELDNGGGDDDVDKHAPTRKRVASGNAKSGAASDALDAEEEDEPRARNKRRS